LIANTSASQQDTTAAAEGQFLLEEQTINKKKSEIYQAGFLSPTVCR
jgi:hypothetical protein